MGVIVGQKQNRGRLLLIILGFLVFLGAATYTGVFFYKKSEAKKVADERIARNNEAYYASLMQNSPTALQDFLMRDILNGVNDKMTKSAAYFITHRFFDNGGNIYEVYDYIEKNPEIAYINQEASAIYPKIFDQIKNRTLPTTYVDRGFYAYLAYAEVLKNRGYADVATLGTAANQYAKLAYFAFALSKEITPAERKNRFAFEQRDRAKALEFMKEARKYIAPLVDGELTEQDIDKRSILVGLNQYAAAYRYLRAMGIQVEVDKNGKEIFAFTTEYAYRNIPELVLFTALLNASTLAILDSPTSADIRSALYPILDVDPVGNLSKFGILKKVLDSRFDKKPAKIGDSNMDLYSKRNQLRLSSKVPEFKAWLIAGGWTEADFQL